MKTTQECWQALIDGETLQVSGFGLNQMVHFENGELVNQLGKQTHIMFTEPFAWSIYTPPKWYDNIPECLIPCRVWNYGGPVRMAFLKAYDDSYSYPFITSSGCHYGNAEQLTKQEIQVLLDNAPEGEKE